MRADDGVLGQGRGPVGHDIIGVIMGRLADRRVDAARQARPAAIAIGALPAVRVGLAVERAVAGEGELAAGRTGRALVNDAADARREGGMADAVEHDLGDRALAVVVLVSGFVIDCAREALERRWARPLCRP